MEWVSVNNRLPEEYTEYLVFMRYFGANERGYFSTANVKSDKITVGVFMPGKLVNGMEDRLIPLNSLPGYEITHWMPLPEPPHD